MRVNVSLSPEVLEELDKRAEYFGLSRSGMISVLVMNSKDSGLNFPKEKK